MLTRRTMTPAERSVRFSAGRLTLWAVLGLVSGCASMEVTRIGSGGPLPAYEMRGADLNHLTAEAKRLCPRGFEVFRSWQSYEKSGNQASPIARWWGLATDLVVPTDKHAQLAVGCKPPPT